MKIPKVLNGKKVIWEKDDYGVDGLPRNSMQEFDLRWVDEFIRKIKPYVYVREIDRLLILIPNQAYGLNETGVMIMKHLLGGHTTDALLQKLGDDPFKRRDVHHFFCDLRAIVSGCLRDNERRIAIDYHEFTGDINRYPVLSEIAVTYRCNLNCEFCYVGDHPQRELNTNDLKKIIFKIYREAMIPSVSFTGGEPLLREDIVSLVSYASQLGVWTNIITNGTLLDRDVVVALKKAGLSSVQVSIEGSNSDVHDYITGKRGAFDSTISGIRLLKEVGIPVHTNTTLSKNNIAHALEIVNLARRLRLSRLSMNLLIPCGRAAGKKEIWMSYSKIGDHILRVKRYAEEHNIKFLWYSPVPLCIFNPIAHGLGNKACAAITGLLSIDPAGNIIPCSSWREPVGSLLRHSFSDLWQSEKLHCYKHMEYAPDECRRCAHFNECKGACPLYWQAVGKGEIIGRP
ncbi:MAG: radical SAM protein [candidate division WOR-3 bacterium]|nr:radical SAM protein [candidate division WOR-3 bacterium]